jgi:hypothetical protein
MHGNAEYHNKLFITVFDISHIFFCILLDQDRDPDPGK